MNENILWKDRKRILGLPISFTRYQATCDRLFTIRGLFRTETDEVLLYRVLDIKLVRTLAQKFFGVGTVTLYCADQSHATLEIRNIKKAEAVRRFLSKAIEQERASKGVMGREIVGAAGLMGGRSEGAAVQEFLDVDGDGIPD